MKSRIRHKVKSMLSKILGRYSHFHFVVRQWDSVNDIEVLSKAISTGYFQHQLVAAQPSLGSYKKVLILAPHQDDESIGCGGLMAKLYCQGTRLRVLYTTDGRQANLGMSEEESIQLRNREAKRALSIVRAEFRQLSIDNKRFVIRPNDLENMRMQINEFGPDLILLPWLFDRPIKHRVLNHMFALLASNLTYRDISVWGYQVHNHLFPNIAFDISEEISTKEQMINCYDSQIANFKDYAHQTIGLNAFNSIYVKDSKYAEIFFGLPLAEYAKLVLRWYNKDLLAIYKGNQDYADNMKTIQQAAQKIYA